ncbi:hypothetical protein GCE9029_05030 [Grimontia celer]|uniref:DUF6708 domain-containing protein n=1 Tax=Grimontia celer TaxID=1796497 RepID=A0A128FG20_9GAMM|nr:DUF6708 domain-containing protein [Grimontia celer]CZF85470.1 hypothetical protein GCE9029_05030 [Grimontia celer]
MPKKINKVSNELWIGASYYGYAPKFKNTISRRGKGFSTGFGTSHIMEDMLNPPPKEIRLDWDGEGDFYNAGYAFVSSTQGEFIDMRVNSVHNRQTLTRLSQFILLPIFLFTYLIIRLTRDDVPWFYLHPVELGVFLVMLLLCFLEICRPIKTPVRFHHKNQEVYVYHKKALYRIPWKECEIATMYAPHHVGYGSFSDAYNLNLWLYPKHCVNDNAGAEPVALNLVTSVDGHADTYIYWEYVRRFMTGGQDAIGAGNEQKQFLFYPTPASSKLKDRAIIWAILPLFFFLLPFISPSQFAIRFNPIKDHWPEDVHKWTGKTIDWH